MNSKSVKYKSNIKRKNECQHAIKRAHERYNLFLTKREVENAAENVGCGQASYYRKVTNRLIMATINLQNTQCRVLYDSRRKMLVTFLPPDCPDAVPYLAEAM